MALQLVIGEGSEERTFEEAGRFSYQVKSAISGRGGVDSIEHAIVFTGKVTSSIVDSVVALSEEVTSKLTERRVQILENDVTKIDLKPNDGYVGPFVTSFKTVPEDGSYTSHATFEIEIFFRAKGNADGGSSSTVYAFGTTLEVTKTQGRTVRKVWAVTASAKTVNEAKTACMNFKPSATDLTETIRTFKEDAKCEATWVWNARRTAWIQEEVFIDDPNAGYVAVPSAGADEDPILHKARNREITVTITGTVFGYSKEECIAPPAHCQEGPKIRRRGYSTWDVEIDNAELGTYKRRYQEVYLCVGITPVINHNGHDTIAFKTPPGDGGLAP